MATLRPCVQKQRADGFYPVYIRVIHDRQSAFIKTGKVVDKKSVKKSREIRDNAVLKYCTEQIALEKAREFDPFGHAGFDPTGIIRLTP